MASGTMMPVGSCFGCRFPNPNVTLDYALKARQYHCWLLQLELKKKILSTLSLEFYLYSSHISIFSNNKNRLTHLKKKKKQKEGLNGNPVISPCLCEVLSIQEAFWQVLLHDNAASIFCVPIPYLANFRSPKHPDSVITYHA